MCITLLLLCLCFSAGHLTVEGGNCTYPQSFACSSIMRPQPITCLALPPVFHRGREQGCGYQTCCEPQMCCLHGLSTQPDRPSLDKSQVDATLYNSSCVQTAHISASLHQSQQLQRCWDTESSTRCPSPTSPVPMIQLNCSRGAPSQPQAADSQTHSQSKSYLPHHAHQREIPADSQTQLSADRSRPGQCQGKLSISTGLQQELSHTAVDRDVMTEESWEERCRAEDARGHSAVAESRELVDEDRMAPSPGQQQQRRVPLTTELRKEQQRTRPALTLRDHRDGRVRN